MTPAAVAAFALNRMLRSDTAPHALPAILAQLVATFSGRCALAFRPATGQPPVVLAAYPENAAADQALIARISALCQAAGGTVDSATFRVRLESGEPSLSVLIALSAPADGECLCALALAGDASEWDEETLSVLNCVAATVSAQIRHANDVAGLAEREALAQTLVNGAPDPILATDSGGRIVIFNPAAEELSGYRRGDALGRDMASLLIPVRSRITFVAHIERYLASHGPGDFTGRMRVPMLRADGTERVVELTPAELPYNGETLFCGFYRDLTELAEQTERFNCLIASAIPGVLVTDERGLIVQVNRSFGAIFGIEAPELLVGTPAAETVRRIKRVFADPREFVRRTSEVFHARKPVSGQQMGSADGRTIECDYWPVMVGGRYSGEIWLAWDMSDRKALEKEREARLEAELAARRSAEQAQQLLEQQNGKLRQLNEAKNEFVGTVSHELRTPLTSIISFSELMRGETSGISKEALTFLDVIDRNAHRLLRLVDDLLLLSRIESGIIPLELGPVSIPEITAEAVRNASPAARYGITLKVSQGSGPVIQADHLRLLQVLDNLIANAVKFSHPGDTVRVRAAWDGCTWRIDVTDSGIGIPPDEIGRLFDRFVRATNARTTGRPGSGLGLSVVKAIAELHGGRVTVDSTLGRGTRFSVYLPGPA